MTLRRYGASKAWTSGPNKMSPQAPSIQFCVNQPRTHAYARDTPRLHCTSTSTYASTSFAPRTRTLRTRFTPQHQVLCHMGKCMFEFEFGAPALGTPVFFLMISGSGEIKMERWKQPHAHAMKIDDADDERSTHADKDPGSRAHGARDGHGAISAVARVLVDQPAAQGLLHVRHHLLHLVKCRAALAFVNYR